MERNAAWTPVDFGRFGMSFNNIDGDTLVAEFYQSPLQTFSRCGLLFFRQGQNFPVEWAENRTVVANPFTVSPNLEHIVANMHLAENIAGLPAPFMIMFRQLVDSVVRGDFVIEK